MTRLVKCVRCNGKGYRQARGMVRIDGSHCGNVKEHCTLCRRTGLITEAQAKRESDG